MNPQRESEREDQYMSDGVMKEVKRELKRINVDGCRYNERLNTKMEGSKLLSYTGLCG
jgi:hypothetical protein